MSATTHYVAWWNLENLFDEENSVDRTDKVRRALGASIKGWTPALRDRKIDQLASVIAQMNGGAGPDLLGVCEIENRTVLNLLVARLGMMLPGRAYQVVHADTADARGIDVAFLYDPALFDAPPGETLSYFHQRVLEVHGPDTPVLGMGDFYDEPFDTSLVVHALSTRPEYPSAATGGQRQGPAVELDVAAAQRAGRVVLLRRRTQPARPIPGQREHGRTRIGDPRGPRQRRHPAVPRHRHRGCLPSTPALRRDGQTRRPRRVPNYEPERVWIQSTKFDKLFGKGIDAQAVLESAEPVRQDLTVRRRGRPVGSGNKPASTRRATGSGKSPEELAEVRSWAESQGIEVASRGRIRAHIMKAYDDAHAR